MNKNNNSQKLERKFIPHEVSIKRVKDSFERSKKKQNENDSNVFVEVK